jgi:hypothetical protein
MSVPPDQAVGLLLPAVQKVRAIDQEAEGYKPGKELGLNHFSPESENEHVRHRGFAIVDRTHLEATDAYFAE